MGDTVIVALITGIFGLTGIFLTRYLTVRFPPKENAKDLDKQPRLNENEKREALAAILKPSDNRMEQYPDIKQYFNHQIDRCLKMFDTNFKSDLTLNVNVRKDDESGVVKSLCGISYKIYKIQDKYESIPLFFEDEATEIISRKIICPEGGDVPIPFKKTYSDKDKVGGKDAYKLVYDIPKELYRHPFLTIETEFIEKGCDHWFQFEWLSLTPCDGVKLVLECGEPLIIKKYMVFDNAKLYTIDFRDDKKRISVSSYKWLNAFTGITVLVAEKTG
ncbi:MAG: hypothetical protein LBI38_04665 [Oscillospiraceae bacterium]|jgi:uncharacterized protein YneF (UPF0154 family)|nr:hypothetical protein [Oscillospiraceae bacterium]